MYIFKLFEDDDKKITFRGTHIKSIAKPIHQRSQFTHTKSDMEWKLDISIDN